MFVFHIHVFEDLNNRRYDVISFMATAKRTLTEDVDHRYSSRELSEKICLGLLENQLRSTWIQEKSTPVCCSN